MISKTRFINTLFTLGFTTYGIGCYLMVLPGFTWTGGLIFGTLPFDAILIFYLIDLVYRGSFTPVLNRVFLLCAAAILLMQASLIVGMHYHSPILKASNTAAMMIEFSVPFLAAVIVQVYNLHNEEFDWATLLLKALLILEAVNLLGIAAGLHNRGHGFEGRVSFPFVLGIYESAHLMSIINLMLLFQLRDFAARPFRFLGVTALYMLNLAMILSVNSRLSFMIFFVITVLFVTKAIKAARGLFTISLFTMPLMMSFALLIYEILSLPFFVALLERVDKKDVTTFNGRTYIWEAAFNWALNDQRNLVFGNGFNGQYHLHMVDHVAKLWGDPHPYNLHMHSAFLQIFVGEGLVGLVVMYLVYWSGFKWYRAEYGARTALAPIFAAFTYMMFCWQIEITGFGYYFGYLFLMMMMAPLCIDPAAITRKRRSLSGEFLSM